MNSDYNDSIQKLIDNSLDIPYSAYCKLIINKDVLTGNELLIAEQAISKVAQYSYEYAKDILNARFELGEVVLSTSMKYGLQYAKHFKFRFEKYEEFLIIHSGTNAALHMVEYAHDIIKGRFEKAELRIDKDDFASSKYYY